MQPFNTICLNTAQELAKCSMISRASVQPLRNGWRIRFYVSGKLCFFGSNGIPRIIKDINIAYRKLESIGINKIERTNDAVTNTIGLKTVQELAKCSMILSTSVQELPTGWQIKFSISDKLCFFGCDGAPRVIKAINTTFRKLSSMGVEKFELELLT